MVSSVYVFSHFFFYVYINLGIICNSVGPLSILLMPLLQVPPVIAQTEGWAMALGTSRERGNSFPSRFMSLPKLSKSVAVHLRILPKVRQLLWGLSQLKPNGSQKEEFRNSEAVLIQS